MESTALSFHFFNDWQECRRRFYFSRILRLEGPRKNALSVGEAIHQAIAEARTGKDYRQYLWDAFQEAPFTEEEERRTNFMKATAFMNSFVQRILTQEYPKKEVETETVIEVDFGKLSARFDAILYEDIPVIDDIKSSNYKNDFDIVESEMLSDQYTHYALLLRREMGINPKIQFTCAYMKPVIPQAFSSDRFIIPTDYQDAYLEGLRFIFYDIKEVLEGFREGASINACFPRTSGTCSKWGCQFSSICRTFAQFDWRKRPLHLPTGFGFSNKNNIEQVDPIFKGDDIWETSNDSSLE